MSTTTRDRLHHAIEAWASTRSAVHSAALNTTVDSICTELDMLRLEVASQAESLGAASETIVRLQAAQPDLTGRHYMDGWSDGVQWAQGEPVAWLRGLLDSVMDFRHTEHGMVRGGDYVRADALIEAATIAAPKAATHVRCGNTPYDEGPFEILPEPIEQDDPVALTDAQIETAFWAAGGRWDGSRWSIEDADLHPMARGLVSAAPKAAPPAAQGEPVAPAGWVLVPTEPTPEMARAGCYRYCAEFVKDYKKMIAAAPKAAPAVALTDQDICRLHDESDVSSGIHWDGFYEGARAAIAEFCRINGITAQGEA